nr:MAG TPA: putative DNA-binding domain protein [Caudoviricetes sp.]
MTGRVIMDYKEKIIKLLEKMDSRKLKIIYHFVRGIL